MTVRTADSRDLQRIAEIHTASWKDAYRGVVPDDFLADFNATAEGWRSTLTKFPGNLTVVDDAGDVVAFCCAGPVVDEATNGPYEFQVYGLHVSPPQRGKGHGRTLLNAAFERAKINELNSAVIWTFRDLIRTRKFYEREGGRLIKTGIWRPNDLSVAEVVYGWDDLRQRR